MALHEITRGGVTYYASDLLSGTPHGFATRLGGVSRGKFESLNLSDSRGDDPDCVAENLRLFCTAIGAEGAPRPRLPVQVHGKTVWRAERIDEPTPEADAVITNVPGLPVGVRHADCVPILLWDPVSRAVAAVHAGWRGTAMGAVAAAVEALQSSYGCRPADIRAVIGPCICPACFETDADVPEAILAHLGDEAAPYLPRTGVKYHPDLRAVNTLWLRRAGVPADRIDGGSVCTCCRPDQFWSHRRLGENRGCQASVIMLRQEETP